MSGQDADAHHYFAYGSNMHSADLLAIPGVHSLGKARLRDHRLRFNRFSLRRQAGAADIVPAPGFTVWGELLAVEAAAFDTLDRKEGAPDAYRRADVTVWHPELGTLPAVTYVVVDPEGTEQVPAEDYVQSMLRAADELGFPVGYVDLLDRILVDASAKTSAEHFRRGSLVVSTSDRVGSRGLGTVERYGSRPHHVGMKGLRLGDRAVLVDCYERPDLAEGVLAVDQNVRHALGVVGMEVYGHTMELVDVSPPVPRYRIVAPRGLVLPVHYPHWLDSEKSLVVLHPKNMALLGVKESEYVDIWFLGRPGGVERARRITIRCFAGTTESLAYVGRDKYPTVHEVCLDREARTALGMTDGDIDAPVLVVPSLARLARDRLLFYALTAFLGVSAVISLLQALAPGLGKAAQALLAVVITAVVTVALAVADLRARIRY